MGCSRRPSSHQSTQRTSAEVENPETQRSIWKSLNEIIIPGSGSTSDIEPAPDSVSISSRPESPSMSIRTSPSMARSGASPSTLAGSSPLLEKMSDGMSTIHLLTPSYPARVSSSALSQQRFRNSRSWVTTTTVTPLSDRPRTRLAT